MFKRCIVCLTLIVSIILCSVISFADPIDFTQVFDKKKLGSGLISINYKVKKDVKTKVMVKKGDTKYFYDLKSQESFPLQFGDGEYTIAVLENVQGNKYKSVALEKVALQLKNQNDVFLNSTQIINWNENMDAIKKARAITKNAENDKEKVVAIYNYIVNNISYDYNKANKINQDYIPAIENTFKTSNGICYDYASLFAAMLRSVQVPTKLIMGYKNDIESYHAWNQVYLKDTNEWITIDTTYDSTLLMNNLPYSMVKNLKEYSIDKEY